LIVTVPVPVGCKLIAAFAPFAVNAPVSTIDVKVASAGVVPPIGVPLIVPPVIVTLPETILPVNVLPLPEIATFEITTSPPGGGVMVKSPLAVEITPPPMFASLD
jgi:hypothetical protein